MDDALRQCINTPYSLGQAHFALQPRRGSLCPTALAAAAIAAHVAERGTLAGWVWQAQLIADAEVKFLAQKAFISYMRSIHLKADKEVPTTLDTPAISHL